MEVEDGGGGGYTVENSIKCTGKDDERKYTAIRTTTTTTTTTKNDNKNKQTTGP